MLICNNLSVIYLMINSERLNLLPKKCVYILERGGDANE